MLDLNLTYTVEWQVHFVPRARRLRRACVVNPFCTPCVTPPYYPVDPEDCETTIAPVPELPCETFDPDCMPFYYLDELIARLNQDCANTSAMGLDLSCQANLIQSDDFQGVFTICCLINCLIAWVASKRGGDCLTIDDLNPLESPPDGVTEEEWYRCRQVIIQLFAFWKNGGGQRIHDAHCLGHSLDNIPLYPGDTGFSVVKQVSLLPKGSYLIASGCRVISEGCECS